MTERLHFHFLSFMSVSYLRYTYLPGWIHAFKEDWKLDTFLKDEVINPIDFSNFKVRLQGPSSLRPE